MDKRMVMDNLSKALRGISKTLLTLLFLDFYGLGNRLLIILLINLIVIYAHKNARHQLITHCV
jgi:hypothetical protein